MGRRSALLLLAVFPAAFLIVGGCRAKPPQRWNVVMLMVDTLRADRLSFYGYARPTAPHLAQLARSGVVLRNARSQAGCTYPSVSSIFTSRWPQHFINRQEKYGMGIPDDTPTLAEILLRHGYSTAAVSTSIIVRATPSEINYQGGYGHGFQSFDETCLEKSAECVNELAGPLTRKLRQPFFLYLHYLDPHPPYRPPPSHENRFAVDPPRQRWVRRGEPTPLVRRLYDGDTTRTYDAADVRYLSDLYDDEISFLDQSLAEIMDGLRAGGLLDHTVVVLLADHGEELLDHGEWGHCRNIAYETVLHTPMVFWIPGGPQGERNHLALNLDVVPTLLDLLKVPYDPAAFAGQTLRPLLDGDRPVHDIALAMQGTSRVASDGRYKLWLDLAGGPPRLFDLQRGEGAPARDVDRRAAAGLRTALLAWLEHEEAGARGDSLRRAQEGTARLKALGYL